MIPNEIGINVAQINGAEIVESWINIRTFSQIID